MKFFLSGNEAIAFGLIGGGVRFISGYPGTPSSEIIQTAIELKKRYKINGYFEWSVNEKSAMEESTAASYTGIASAAAFKQVGLNVALDPFMNTALTGTVGGLVIVSADDPGPHSSQTEQDSRFLAFFAKIPVFDLSTPKEAYEFSKKAVELSKQFEIPVMVRTTTRISHSREDIEISDRYNFPKADIRFNKDKDRFAATPHFRYLLHKKLNQKVEDIKKVFKPREYFKGHTLIITSGISFAYLYDIVRKHGIEDSVRLLKYDLPYPIDDDYLQGFIDRHETVLVVEESYPLLEMQIKNRTKVQGRLNGAVPNEGELTGDVIENILFDLNIIEKNTVKHSVNPPFIRPSLCPGCGHRSAFFSIKKVFGESAVYTGDIGCYTLGLNLDAVDTVHCMGASVSFAFGFNKALSLAGNDQPIVATIGDSTFFHSGIAPLINAVHNRAKFLLVILDNETVAMTGNQKTPQDDSDSYDNSASPIKLERLIKGLGIEFLEVIDAYDIEKSIKTIKLAKDYIENESRVAVIILRHPCVYTKAALENNIRFKDVFVDKNRCTGCKVCIRTFECPSLLFIDGKVQIDRLSCINCGQCIYSCPFDAIGVKR